MEQKLYNPRNWSIDTYTKKPQLSRKMIRVGDGPRFARYYIRVRASLVIIIYIYTYIFIRKRLSKMNDGSSTRQARKLHSSLIFFFPRGITAEALLQRTEYRLATLCLIGGWLRLKKRHSRERKHQLFPSRTYCDRVVSSLYIIYIICIYLILVFSLIIAFTVSPSRDVIFFFLCFLYS